MSNGLQLNLSEAATQNKTKKGIQYRLSLNAGQSILQYFRPSLSYHLSLSSLFCLFLSCRIRQGLLNLASSLPWVVHGGHGLRIFVQHGIYLRRFCGGSTPSATLLRYLVYVICNSKCLHSFLLKMCTLFHDYFLI